MKKFLLLFLAAAAAAFGQVQIPWSDIADKPTSLGGYARQALAFDGSSGATFGGPTIGTADFTLAAYVNPASFAVAVSIAGNATQCFDLPSATSMRLYDTTTPASVTVPTMPTGIWTHVAWVRSGTTLSAYVNGQLAGTTTCSLSLAALTSIGSINSVPGSNRLTGQLIPPVIYNRALSATEIGTLFSNGALGVGDYNSATFANAIASVGRNVDFSNGATDWVSTNGATVSVVSSKLHVVVASGGQVASLASGYFGGDFVAGRRYRIGFTVSNFTPGQTLRVSAGGSNEVMRDYASPDGSYSFEWTASGTGTQLFFIGMAAVTFDLDDISILRLGLAAAPESGARGLGPQWSDATGNSAHVHLPGDGTGAVTWARPGASDGWFTYTRTSSGYVVGDQAVIPAGCYISQLWVSGNGTVTIGESAGTPANVVASYTAGAAAPATLLLRTTTNAKLYLALGTATTATIKAHLVKVP